MKWTAIFFHGRRIKLLTRRLEHLPHVAGSVADAPLSPRVRQPPGWPCRCFDWALDLPLPIIRSCVHLPGYVEVPAVCSRWSQKLLVRAIQSGQQGSSQSQIYNGRLERTLATEGALRRVKPIITRVVISASVFSYSCSSPGIRPSESRTSPSSQTAVG